MSEKKEYVTDNDVERENLKMGCEQIKSMHSMQLERLKSADEKLNMVLVFNGAVLALLIAVLPFDFEIKSRLIHSIVFFSFFMISIVATIIVIFIGLYPRKIKQISSEDYVNPSTYKCTFEQFVGKLTSGLECSVKSIAKAVEIKHKMNKCAMCFTITNIVFISAMLIIKII